MFTLGICNLTAAVSEERLSQKKMDNSFKLFGLNIIPSVNPTQVITNTSNSIFLKSKLFITPILI